MPTECGGPIKDDVTVVLTPEDQFKVCVRIAFAKIVTSRNS